MADPARPPRYPTAGSPRADGDGKRTGDDTRDDGPVAESGNGHADGDSRGDDFASDLDGRQRGIAQLPLQKSEMLHAGGIDDEGRRQRNEDEGRSRIVVETADSGSGREAKQSEQRTNGDVEPEQGGNLRVGNLRSLNCCSRQPAGRENLESAGDDGDHRHQAEIARIEKVGERHERDEAHERPCRLADKPGRAAANCLLLQILQLGAPGRIGRRKAGLAVEAALSQGAIAPSGRPQSETMSADSLRRQSRHGRRAGRSFSGFDRRQRLVVSLSPRPSSVEAGGVTLPRFLHTLQPNLPPPGIDPSWAEHAAAAEARPAGDVLQYHRRRLQRLHAPGLLVEKPLHPRDDPVLAAAIRHHLGIEAQPPIGVARIDRVPGSPRET